VPRGEKNKNRKSHPPRVAFFCVREWEEGKKAKRESAVLFKTV
jgi:hypothetical protein